MEVEVDPGRSGSVRIDGVAYDKEELDAVFSANVDEQRQAMHQREPLLQNGDEHNGTGTGRKASQGGLLASGDPNPRPSRRRRLNGRTYEQDEINAMLYMQRQPPKRCHTQSRCIG